LFAQKGFLFVIKDWLILPKQITLAKLINPFDDTYFMKKALQEAERAYDNGEVPVGAVVVVNNRIIGRAHNLVEQLHDVTAHAEMQAITSASNFLGGKYLHGCTLYVTLEPCQMCAGALYWSQISKLVYGAADLERGYNVMGTSLHPKTEVVSGVLEDEASELLKRFFIKKRNLN
jgi:tRNA(adenine34) deaminase